MITFRVTLFVVYVAVSVYVLTDSLNSNNIL